MLESTNEAQLWELGCQADPVRNCFLIPAIAALLADRTPAAILDVGAGTGYVARHLHRRLHGDPEWTLVDTNPNRLEVARSLAPYGMRLRYVSQDLFELGPAAGGPFDVVLLTFTLLEIQDFARCLAKLARLMTDQGLLLVALPDVLNDVGSAADTDSQLFRDFVGGVADLQKVDKFTGRTYPFRAVRIERILSAALAAGLVMTTLEESGEGGSSIYLLGFEKLARCSRG